MTGPVTVCPDCGAGFTGNQAHCTTCTPHRTFADPEAYEAHRRGPRCAHPARLPYLAQHQGVWVLSAIPGQLALPGVRR